jgi:ubiquinone/menaquinone biosynthesis C-methylase UbiE
MENKEAKSLVQEQFGKNAEKYVESESHAKATDLSEMIDWLTPDPSWIALDIATGGGHVTKALSPHVRWVFSTDLTCEMLETAKKHLDPTSQNVWYVLADSKALPFLNESFDVIVCRIAAHHFPSPDQFISEVNRVLKPGGKFLLIDNVSPEDHLLDVFINKLEKLRDKSHVRCYSTLEWKRWIEETDLIHEHSHLRKKTYDFPVWVKRTTESEAQVHQVEEHILSASKEIQAYFAVTLKENQILSLQIDEWMAMYTKKHVKNEKGKLNNLVDL